MLFLPTRQLRRIGWLAIFAMLALALLPTVSHALSASRGAVGSWTEVCTPQGVRLVALEADQAGDADQLSLGGHLEHCAYCVAGTPLLAPPPSDRMPLLLPVTRDALPPLFLHAPRTLHAWRSAQPRAPPLNA